MELPAATKPTNANFVRVIRKKCSMNQGCHKRFYRHMFFRIIYFFPFETSATASCGYMLYIINITSVSAHWPILMPTFEHPFQMIGCLLKLAGSAWNLQPILSVQVVFFFWNFSQEFTKVFMAPQGIHEGPHGDVRKKLHLQIQKHLAWDATCVFMPQSGDMIIWWLKLPQLSWRLVHRLSHCYNSQGV